MGFNEFGKGRGVGEMREKKRKRDSTTESGERARREKTKKLLAELVGEHDEERCAQLLAECDKRDRELLEELVRECDGELKSELDERYDELLAEWEEHSNELAAELKGKRRRVRKGKRET
jgi:hypothetical protein